MLWGSFRQFISINLTFFEITQYIAEHKEEKKNPMACFFHTLKYQAKSLKGLCIKLVELYNIVFPH